MTKVFRLILILSTLFGPLQAQQHNFEKLANDIFSINLNKSKIAVIFESKSSGISVSNAKAIEEAVITAIQRKAASLNHNVIATKELEKIYDYKQITGDKSDFTELIEKTKADLLITVSIQKLSSKSAQISAKLLGVAGTDSGKVINASKVYETAISPNVRVFVEGVFDNNEHRAKFDDDIIIGLGSSKAINITKSKTDVDYLIRAEISYRIEDVKTKESQGADMMSQMLQGMGSDMPIKGLSDSLGKIGKAKVVNASTKITSTDLNGKRTMIEHNESKTLQSDVSDDQLRSEVALTVKLSIKTASESLASALIDEPSGGSIKKSKSKSLLD